ncbi:MAG: VOC family protein [Prochloraceae cyanobacterium]|nr:VOC family protein [Prochloraceae cyanobacterium]
MNDRPIFHLAIPINDVAKAKNFYCEGLGCQLGRETPTAIILNFYTHQVVAHVTSETLTPPKSIYPRHFGLIFPSLSDWEEIVARAEQKNLHFYQQPKLRFPGKITEHRTFFLEDPFYNLLEFKFYLHSEAIFGAIESAAIGDRD